MVSGILSDYTCCMCTPARRLPSAAAKLQNRWLHSRAPKLPDNNGMLQLLQQLYCSSAINVYGNRIMEMSFTIVIGRTSIVVQASTLNAELELCRSISPASPCCTASQSFAAYRKIYVHQDVQKSATPRRHGST